MLPHIRLRRLYVIAVVLAVLGGAMLAAVRINTPATVGENAAAGDTAPPLATVGVWEGQLAVFPPQGGTPTTVYDVYVASLPTTEQEVLHAGIPVYTEEALQRLLEDYTG